MNTEHERITPTERQVNNMDLSEAVPGSLRDLVAVNGSPDVHDMSKEVLESDLVEDRLLDRLISPSDARKITSSALQHQARRVAANQPQDDPEGFTLSDYVNAFCDFDGVDDSSLKREDFVAAAPVLFSCKDLAEANLRSANELGLRSGATSLEIRIEKQFCDFCDIYTRKISELLCELDASPKILLPFFPVGNKTTAGIHSSALLQSCLLPRMFELKYLSFFAKMENEFPILAPLTGFSSKVFSGVSVFYLKPKVTGLKSPALQRLNHEFGIYGLELEFRLSHRWSSNNAYTWEAHFYCKRKR